MTSLHSPSYVRCAFVALALTVALASPAFAQSLLPAVDFSTIADADSDNWPADFNRDGVTDLLARNKTSGRIEVWIGHGNGQFSPRLQSTTVGWPAATGDVNNDGRVDAIVRTLSELIVLPGNGDGTLGAPIGILPVFATFALVADLDNDGKRDVIVADEEHSPALHVLPGNGDFTFRPEIGLFTGANPYGGFAIDVDGNGFRDLVIAHAMESRLTIYRHSGGFVFTQVDVPVDRTTTDVTVFDVNRDGRLDLIVSARSEVINPWRDGFVYVYLGMSGGTFAPARVFATVGGTNSVVVGDFTHDGLLDIATSNRSRMQRDNPCGSDFTDVDSVSILPGRGDGTFGAEVSFAMDVQTGNEAIEPFRVGSLNTSDVNGDGFPDLLPGGGRILVTAAPRANRPPTANAGPDQRVIGDTVATLIGTGTDPDHHFLRFLWSDENGPFDPREPQPGSRGAPRRCYFQPDDAPPHTVTLTVTDDHGGTASDSLTITFEPSPAPPAVTVTAPAAGEVVLAGRPYTIRFTATDRDGVARIDASFRTSPSGAFTPIAECQSMDAATTGCVWQNPGPLTEQAQILITAVDTTGAEGANTSGVFAIRPAPPGTLPVGWESRDIGAVGAAGSARFDDGVFTVRGSGADIWNTSDEFHYAYISTGGDFEVTARVLSVQNVDPWTKAGLMIRGDLTADAMHASVFAVPTTQKPLAFQRRQTTGGASVHTAGEFTTPPVWLKLTRRGNVITGAYKKTLTAPWTIAWQDTIEFRFSVLVGLAVTSHRDGVVAEARFDNVSIRRLDAYQTRDIGAVGVPGTTYTDGVQYRVLASGADIWNTADSFRYVHWVTGPHTTITARVMSVEDTDPWAKAGVMFRESLAANAKQVMAIASAGRGIAMQYRSATGGTSAQAAIRSGAAPIWIRLTRDGDVFTSATSVDGVTWSTLGTVSVPMASTGIYVGLAVTAHDNSERTLAVFEDVVVEGH